MLGYIGKVNEIKEKARKAAKKTVVKAMQTSEILKGLFASTLDGWKDDKEKFKLELINDIKTFLFTKWEKTMESRFSIR